MREDQIIIAATREFLQNTEHTQRTWGENRLYPLLERDGVVLAKEFKDVDKYERNLAVMQNQISKVMNGNLAFPLSWKWSWVHSLPDPYVSRCIQELAALMPSTVPSHNENPVQADAGRLAVEFGEAITAVAIIAADGVYDENDSIDDCEKALNELYDARDQANAQIAEIERLTGVRVPRSEARRPAVSVKVIVDEG